MTETGGWRIAVDRGGTFTDIVAHAPDGTIHVRKVPSETSSDAAVAAIREITSAPAGRPISSEVVASLRCGTTVATNALLERRGERTALFVTEGFPDLLTIGSGERPELFALHVVRPAALPERVFEVPERVLADGTVRMRLDEPALWVEHSDAVLDMAERASTPNHHNHASCGECSEEMGSPGT